MRSISTCSDIKCLGCNGRGFAHCGCWPFDCVCGYGDILCEECYGSGNADQECDDFDEQQSREFERGGERLA